jgi:hypothetical protein
MYTCGNLSHCSTYRLSGERTVSPLVMRVTFTSVPDCFDRLLHSGVETKYVGISPTATWTTPIHLHLSRAPVLSLLGSARLGYEHTLASSGRLREEIMDCRYSNMVAIPLGGSPGANKAHNMWSTDENRTPVGEFSPSGPMSGPGVHSLGRRGFVREFASLCSPREIPSW